MKPRRTPNADTARRRERGRRLGQPEAADNLDVALEDEFTPRRRSTLDAIWDDTPVRRGRR